MKSIAPAIGLVLVLFAVPMQAQTPPPSPGVPLLTKEQRAEIEKMLTEATKEVFAGINQLSTEPWAKSLSPEFQEHLAGGNMAPAAAGKEAFLKWVTDLHGQRASQKFEPDVLKVHVLSPDLAYVVLAGGGTVTLKSGRHGGFGFAATWVWRKEQAGWRIVHIHDSWW